MLAEAELLAKKLSAIDYIPGIDIPDGQGKQLMLAPEERDLSDAEQQNAEFDEEADRLFGDISESEEASEEDAEIEEKEEEGMSEAVSETMGSPQHQRAANGEVHSSEEQPRNGVHLGSGMLTAASELHASQEMASAASDNSPGSAAAPPSAAVLNHLQYVAAKPTEMTSFSLPGTSLHIKCGARAFLLGL